MTALAQEPGWFGYDWHTVDASIALLALIVTTAYVVFTIKTFQQIKLQTDLQSRAVLMVVATIKQYDTPSRALDPAIVKIHEKWRGILKANVPSASSRSDQMITLTLRNRGRSDIVWWTVTVSVDVRPGEHLEKNAQIGGNKLSWTVLSSGSKDLIYQGEDVTIDVAPSGQFPIALFTWKIAFEDSRSQKYDTYLGDHSLEDSNKLATPPAAVSASLPSPTSEQAENAPTADAP